MFEDEAPQPLEESPPIQEEQLSEDIDELDALRAELATVRAELETLRTSIGEHSHDGYAATDHDHGGAVPSEETTGEEGETIPGEAEISTEDDISPKREHFWFRKYGA